MNKRMTNWMLVVSGKKKRQNNTNCIAKTNKYDNDEILYFFFVHFLVIETFSLKGQQKLYISII